MSDDLKIDLTLETQEAIKELAKFRKKAIDDSAKAAKSFKKMSGAWNSFVGNLGAIAVAKSFQLIGRASKEAFDFLITGSIEASMKLETMSVSFITLLNSAGLARKMMGDLQEFAASTPFQIEGIAEAAKQLLSYGVVQDEIMDKMKKVGDVAAGAGVPMKDLAIIFGQVKSVGKLTAERLNQLGERGVVVTDALAKATGKASSSIRDMISKGQIDFKTFEQAFDSLSEKGGLFAGGMERQSKTVAGKISTLKDNIFGLQVAIGDEFQPVAKKVIDMAIGGVQDLLKFVKENSVELQKLAIGGFGAVAQAVGLAVDSIMGLIKTYKTFKNIVDEKMDTAALDVMVEKQKEAQDKLHKLTQARMNKEQQLYAERLKKQIASNQMAIDMEKEAIEKKATQRDAEYENLTGFQEKLNELKASFLKQGADLEVESEEKKKARQLKLDEDAAKKSLIAKKVADEKRAIQDQKDKNDKLRREAETAKKEMIIRSSHFKASANLINALSELSALGGKKTFGVTKALAMAAIPIDTAAGIMKAMTLPPPLSYMQAATVGIMGVTQLAKVASQKPPSYADGGIVAGQPSALDNTMANVASGEMILNQDQQANLYNIAQSGGNNNQEIVIQIDGREIARAVRNEISEGFVLA